MTTAMFAGVDAAGKARRAGQALVARAERLIAAAGLRAAERASVEVIGAGDTFGPERRNDAATEAVVKVGARHPETAGARDPRRRVRADGARRAGHDRLLRRAPARRARRSACYHLLVDKADVPVDVTLGDDGATAVALEIAAGQRRRAGRRRPSSPTEAGAAGRRATITVALRRLAYARSGDKGNNANIGVIARRPEFARRRSASR